MPERYRNFLAIGMLLLILGGGGAIVVYELPYTVPDIGIILSFFPVLLALFNVNADESFTQLARDPVNAALWAGFALLTSGLLVNAGIDWMIALAAGCLLLPAYVMLVRLIQEAGRRQLGFAFFNFTLLLLFLPIVLDDGNWTRWNPLAPAWLFVVLDSSWLHTVVLAGYVALIGWGLPRPR